MALSLDCRLLEGKDHILFSHRFPPVLSVGQALHKYLLNEQWSVSTYVINLDLPFNSFVIYGKSYFYQS